MRFVDVVPLVRLPRGVRQRYTYAIDGSAKPFAIVRIRFRKALTWGVIVAPAKPVASLRSKILTVETQLQPWHVSRDQQFLVEQLQHIYGASESLAYLTAIPALPARPADVTFRTPSVRRIRAENILKKVSGRVAVTGQNFTVSDSLLRDFVLKQIAQGGQVACLYPNVYAAQTAANYFATYAPTTCVTSEKKSSDIGAAYQGIQAGKIQVICGTRSAVFMPYIRLRGIVIWNAYDKGHHSWDQQPTYDVRLLAETLSQKNKIPLLVSAPLPPLFWSTPSSRLERPLPTKPEIRIVDRRHFRASPGAPYSDEVQSIVAAAGGQRILFFTPRLGAGVIACTECGTVVACKNCGTFVPPTNERQTICLRCATPLPSLEHCPRCGHQQLQIIGSGFNHLASWIEQHLPERALVRLEAKTFSTSQKIDKALESCKKNTAVLCVASPAALSYLSFLPLFDIVILLRPELLLAAPTWRAAEETAQTLYALTFAAKETCIVETATPDHSVLQRWLDGQSNAFLAQEFIDRKRFAYPPAVRMIQLTFTDRDTAGYEKLLTEIKRFHQATVATVGKVGRGPITFHVSPQTSLAPFWPQVPSNVRIDINANSWDTAAEPQT